MKYVFEIVFPANNHGKISKGKKIQTDIPRKKFLETLSFVLPAKTTVRLIVENSGRPNSLDIVYF